MSSEILTKTKSTLVLVGIAVFLVLIVILNTFRIGNVSGDEVGVLVSNWSGTLTDRQEAGAVIYNGWFTDFYPIDQSRQELHMTAERNVGNRPGADYVKVKTRDGNDVFVDITIYYEIDPTRALEVIRESGPGDAYKEKWVRDYSRSICRYVFGELSSEEFYVAHLREEKRDRAKAILNKHLEPHAIRIVSLNVQDFGYRSEYENKITAKKQADQQVERYRSELKEALARKKKLIFQEKENLQNSLVQYRGELEQEKIQANGQAAKLVKDAEAQAEKVIKDAQAEAGKLLENVQAQVARLLQEAEGQAAQVREEAQAKAAKLLQEADAMASEIKNRGEATRVRYEQEAAAILATAKAQAKGRTAQVEALQGEGGRRVVLATYAAKLAGLKLSGKPVVVDSDMKRLLHNEESTRRERERGADK